MSILQEIQKWSENLPAWQQEAVAKLYAAKTLSDNDWTRLYALLKIEHGIPVEAPITAERLAPEQVAAPQKPKRLVQLVAIKNLRQVNAIAAGQHLPVAPTGLTIIYGENGAGKSGYSRVLKKACRARDQREPILPNARKPSDRPIPAQAEFDLLVDGVAVSVGWIDGKTAPEQLSAISIFDARCARAYIDNQGDFAYAPYGLDILEGLVEVCKKLKAMAVTEAADNKPNTDIFATLSKTQTEVGKLLLNLSAVTTQEAVEALTTLTEAEQQKLTIIVKTLAEPDPKQKAQTLRQLASRFSSLSERIATAINIVNDDKVAALHLLINKSNEAKQAAELAAKAFRETPDQLAGTGDDAWRALFEAARAFAKESHGDKDFPHLGAEAACPLCQNKLNDDGAARLAAFDAFIQQETQKTADTAKQSAKDAFIAIREANLSLLIDKALIIDLANMDPPMDAVCTALQTNLTERQANILGAVHSKIGWEEIQVLAENPSESLATITQRLQDEAKALDAAMDEKGKAAMLIEHAELEARVKFADYKVATLDAISKFALCKKLAACADATGSTGISRKSTDLARIMATPQVAEALNAELKNLNVHELEVVMKNESPLGKTKFKLTLELPGGGSPAAILSEGQQRAIAIASFMAEIKLAGGTGGLVFDDPVSSLDDQRRWHVAELLAKEALSRQVIVFTHDIYFLCVLQQVADTTGAIHLTQCIHQTADGFGVQTDNVPFDTLSTSKRVSALRQMQTGAEKAHKAGEAAEATRLIGETYRHLRLAWERGVEEVLFDGVVTRFGEGVSTQKLKSVIVEDSDYKTIDAGMTKSSKFAHDPAAKARPPMPHPDELRSDIENLETWRKSVVDRKKTIEQRRA